MDLINKYSGFIDFHYDGSTEDFTSRIIESAEGKIDITAPTGVYANGKNIVRSVNGTFAGTDGNVTLGVGVYLKETWKSGTSWYRVWSDGYIEQGGRSSGSVTTSFVKPFSNTPNVIAGIGTITDSSCNSTVYVNTVSTVSFSTYKIRGNSGNQVTDNGLFYWIAMGY